MTLLSPPNPNRHPRYEDKGHCIRGITMLVIKALIGIIRYDDVERPLNRPRVISTGISTPPVKPLLVVLRSIALKALLVPQELW